MSRTIDAVLREWRELESELELTADARARSAIQQVIADRRAEYQALVDVAWDAFAGEPVLA